MLQRESARRGIVLLTLVGIASQLIGFIYRIALSQLIGAEVLGLYQLIMPVYSVLLSLSSVGLCSAVSYLSAQYQAVGNYRAIWALRRRALRFFYLLCILPCSLLLVFSDQFSVYLLGDARTRLGLMLLVPCLLLTGIENLQKNYFYGVGYVRPAATTEFIEQILRSLLVLGLLVVLVPDSPERIVGIIILGMILCEVFSAIAQTVLFRRHLGRSERQRGAGVPGDILRAEMLRIAVPIGATALLGNLLGSANAVLVPRLLVQGGMERSEAMSQFGVMFGMTIPMLLLPMAFLGALNLVLAPKLSEAKALGQRRRIRGQIRKAIAAANLLLIPSLALLAVIGPSLGPILYKDARAGDHMELLAISILLHSFHGLLATCLSGLGLQAPAAKYALVTDVVQLLITLATVGLPGVGLLGFVWGYIMSGAVGAGLCWRRLRAATGLSMPLYSWFVAPLLASALAGSTAALIQSVFLREGYSEVVSGLFCLLAGLLLYALALQIQGVSPAVLFGEKELASWEEKEYTKDKKR